MARPKANALNAQMLEELRAAFATAANDAGVRGVVLASAVPGIFSAGFDAREIFPYGAAEISHAARKPTTQMTVAKPQLPVAPPMPMPITAVMSITTSHTKNLIPVSTITANWLVT